MPAGRTRPVVVLLPPVGTAELAPNQPQYPGDGVPRLEAQDGVGHKTLAMTQRYGHLRPEDLDGLVE